MTRSEDAARARRALLAARLRGATPSGTPAPRQVDPAHVPLSPEQERLWLHDQLHPGSAAYTICDAVRIDGPVEAAALGAAAAEVATRHESLRTTFHADGGVPYARVHDRLAPEVTHHQGPPPLAEIQRRPFDLTQGPLLRLDIGETGPDEHVLVLSLHHIIGDGWSMSLLVKELTAVYLGAALPTLTEQYPDVVVRRRNLRDTPAFQAQLTYWQKELSAADPVPTRTDTAGATVPVSLSPDLATRLTKACQAHKVTPFMVLLAAFGTVLAARTDTPHPVIGTPVAGRSGAEEEQLIGYFTNTLPLVLNTSGAPTAADLWSRARSATLGALANADVSLSEIGDAASGPVFQALFALQNYPFDPIHVNELTITPVPVSKHEAKVDVSLYLYERDGGFEGYLEHRLSVLPTPSATTFAAEVVRVVEAMLAAPDREVAPTSAAEQAHLLGPRAGAPRPRPDVLVHHLVESTAAQTPTAPAIIDPDGTTLTYAELDRAANHLAQWLRTGGLAPEEPVGLLLPRGAKLVTAMLAVLKAGGAFVPVDPDYPEHRITAMTEGTRLILTPTTWPPLPETGGLRPPKQSLPSTPDTPAPNQPLTDHRPPNPHESPTRPRGGPPISSLSPSTDNPGPIRPSAGDVHPGNPHESPTHALGGPPNSTLPAGTDNPRPNRPSAGDVHPTNPHESPTHALGGPPNSSLPPTTDNPGPNQTATDDVHPANANESPTRASGGPPISSLSAGTDNCGERLAYVIYTSGSTGRPKGIGAQHGGVVNHNLSTVERFGLTASDRVLHFSSPSFDASIEETLPALAVGAVVVARPADLTDSFRRLDEFIRAHGITVLGLPTALWERWHHHLRETGTSVPPSVRLVTLSGQRVNAESVRLWVSEPATAGVELINTYGPTEATVTTSTHLATADAGEVPIGTPWPNYRVYVVDPWLRLVPDGAVGELCVGGAGVSRGYLGRPDLTAASFVPDPFGAPGARMYRTGDQVRWRDDGTLEFVARLDDQVKVRGNRVEPGEVESVLATHPAVAQCAVVAYADGRGETTLGAHVVLRDDTTPDVLAGYLAGRLPAYMVPSGFVVHDGFPLTPNGKVDRRALPAPVRESAGFRAPAGRWEEGLAALWCDVLGVARVGRDDDFFRLGGNSLSAMVLTSRVEHELGRKVPLGAVFANSTLVAMAAVVGGARESTVDPIAPAPEAEHYPASSGQRQIFLLQEGSGSGTSYNMPFALEVRGPADPGVLRMALQRLVDRHEALRTTFAFVDGEVRQRVRAGVLVELPVTDVSDVDEVLNGLVRPFDLGADVLLRAHWLRVAPEHGVLFLDLHHIAADGASLEILVDEFLALVDGAELAPVSVQYKDFAHWQATQDSDHAAYWREVLRDPPELDLPYDHPRPERRSFDGFTTEFAIPAGTVDALTRLAADAGATANIALLSVYAAVLSRYAGQTEVPVGSLVPGRNHPDLARTVGMFANFLPLRLSVRPGDSFATLLARGRDRVLADYEHQDLPFDEIVSLAGRPPAPGRNPLFDTMLIFHGGGPPAPGEHAGLSFEHRPVTHGTAKLDLKLDVFPRPDGALTVQIEANRALLEPSSVDRLAGHLQALCAAVVAEPDTELDRLPWLPEADLVAITAKRRRLLTLTIAATFTAEPIAEHVRWWCERFGLATRLTFTGIDQVFQELLDPASTLNTAEGPRLLLVRFEDWAGADLERTSRDLLAAIAGKRLLVGVLPGPLADRWRRDLAELPDITIVDLVAPIARYGVREWADPAAYELGRIPYTPGFFAAAGAQVARCLVVRNTPPFKVLAVDADNTLWRGVVGEDGPLGVVPDQAVQRMLLRKRAEGMLLVLLSKNTEDDLWAVFDTNPGMLLSRQHFAGHRVNWAPKPANLRELAAELGLGLDSVVFLDDSTAECAQMRAELPEVLTLRLPAEGTEHFLSHVWALDAADVTDDDRHRADRYAAERRRTEASSVPDFLAGLGLTASLHEATPAELDRAAQLTLRTNQFNLSGLRLRPEELATHLAEPTRHCHILAVRDRFGDHGLVGALLTTHRGTELRVDNLVLSCRVLGRTVEEAVLAGLRALCTELGTTHVTATFHRTDRNEPAAAFLRDYGWHPGDAGTLWTLMYAELPERARHIALTYGEPLPPVSTEPVVTAEKTDHPWLPYRLDHIGVAVRDLPTAVRRFESLGFTASPVVEDPRQRSVLVMLDRPGHHRVELVGAAGPDSPTAEILARHGDHPYHLCFQVRSLPAALAEWTDAGIAFEPVTDPQPAVLFGGRHVQFCHVTGVGLIELVEIDGATTPDLAPPAPPASDGDITVGVTDLAAATAFFTLLGYGNDSATLTLSTDGGLRMAVPGAEDYLGASPHADWLDDVTDDTRLTHRAHLVPLRHTTEAALLRLPVTARARGSHVPPRDDTERRLVALFADVLAATDVGVTDSWFALGGHSLTAVTLLSRLQRETGVALTLQDLFDRPTPAALAELVRGHDTTTTGPLPTAEPGPVVPLSAAQRQLMVAHHLNPDGTDDNLPHAVSLRGEPDLDRMRAALAALVARHETLRTGFRLIDGEVRQVVLDDVTVGIETGAATGTVAEEVTRFVRPFDLAEPPLLRVALLRRAQDHLLLVDVHHIVSDGVSIALLVEDFVALYEGAELPPVRQFRDWVAYERQLPDGDAERYWLDRFSDAPPALDLPLDRPRPAVRDTRGGNVRRHAGPDVLAGLRKVAERAGATVYMTVLAALYVTLWRHSRQTDLVVGTPSAGRTHPDVARTVGPFFTVLPLRVTLDPSRPFTAFLDQVRATVLDGMAHQLYPFSQLVDRLGLDRDASRNPLFDVMLAFQEDHADGVDGELSVTSLDLDTGRSLFDLELFAHATEDGVEFTLEYAAALFDRATAERVADRFLLALRAIAADPGQPLCRWDLLDPAERTELVAGLGTRELTVPAGDTVVARVLAQDPARVALVCGGERRTYGELVAGARRVAGLLREHGVERAEIVGVQLDRGILLAECVLGIWLAGAAYLPLDPRHPKARRQGMLTDAGSRFVLTTGDLAGAIDPTATPAAAEPVPVLPDDLAYVLFTSGSTGRPKGALVEHRGMLNHMLAKVTDLGLDEHTVLAQNASQCFDISIWQLFGALVVGGRTVICPDEVAADPRALLATVRAEGVTTLEVVPSLLDVTLDLPVTTPLAGLRHLLVTGEAVPVPLLARWFRRFPAVPVVNAYGPTEASDDITHHILLAAPDGTSVPIGRPIPNARVYVVDDTVPLDSPAALSPPGVVGEICVAGPCVGRGYAGDAERTAAAFPPDPFVGGRLYRTGDLGRWLPDGTLEFLGRKDDQVKVRGHRIELGEVEAALARAGAAAAAVRDGLLVGYVVTGESPDAIKARVGAELPAYLVPDVVVVLDRLPLTANGKIDRAALPAPAPVSAEAVPLAGDLEHAVAALFTEVLGVEVTDAAADFFALGGQSLKAVLLLALAQERLGVLVPLAEVFREPTVRGVAAAVTRRASMDEHPVTRLGPARDDAVFAFPPIAGWGLVYLPFAEALPDHEVHAFDFLADEHRVKRYADLVEERRPAGALTLLGYSAGGNLAFEVAVELESRGRTVRELVLYDVLYRDERTEESAESIAARVRADMAEGMAALDPRLRQALSVEALQSLAAGRRAAYVAYWQSLRHRCRVAADVVLVRAEDSDLDETAVAAWRRATTGHVTVLSGSGRHAEMMAHPHAGANARLTRDR